MVKVSKSTLKSYFEAGDIPNQSQYVDLIDSQFNLVDTEVQILAGNLRRYFWILKFKKSFFSGCRDISRNRQRGG